MDAISWVLIGLSIVALLCIIGFFVIRAILIRKAATAVVVCLFSFLYWIFPLDIFIDPMFIGHVVTAVLFLYSACKIFGNDSR